MDKVRYPLLIREKGKQISGARPHGTRTISAIRLRRRRIQDRIHKGLSIKDICTEGVGEWL